MLKIKHFLTVLTCVPLSLVTFQPPAYSQSVGVAGFNSGVGTGGNITVNANLGGTTTADGTVGTTISFIISPAEIAAAQAAVPEPGSATIAVLNSNPPPGTATPIQQPTAQVEGKVEFKQAGKTDRILPYPLADGIVLNQAAVLAIVTLGGTIGASDAQIRAAVNIASTGADAKQIFAMLINASNLFASVKTGNTKSLDKGLLLAQGGATVSVDAAALAAAIDSYNDLLSDSKPATVAKLAENKPFMKVGGALRSMRSAFN